MATSDARPSCRYKKYIAPVQEHAKPLVHHANDNKQSASLLLHECASRR